MRWDPPPVRTRATWMRTITENDVELYAQITGDRNPLHFDPPFAAATSFGRPVVQGGLTNGLFNALVAMELPGPGSVFLHQEWDYPALVFIGDIFTAEAEVIEARADSPSLVSAVSPLARTAWRSSEANALSGRFDPRAS